MIGGRLSARAPWLAVAAGAYTTVASRALWEASEKVRAPLHEGSLDGARVAVSALVGRSTEDLDAAEVARAVVESVAENTVDAIVAPIAWAALGGMPGAFAFRAVNTLDAMVGHRSVRYQRFGWASARADDVAAWLPARITAVLVAAVRPGSAGEIWRAVRTQAPSHPSPNAGVAEAAFAAALGVRLGGINRYGERVEQRPQLGFGSAVTTADIDRARRLSRDVTVALGLLIAGLGLGVGGVSAGWRR